MDVLKLDDQLCYALYSASMAVQRAYKPLLDRMGITGGRMWADWPRSSRSNRAR